jgi:hypothetical protein
MGNYLDLTRNSATFFVFLTAFFFMSANDYGQCNAEGSLSHLLVLIMIIYQYPKAPLACV